MAIVKDKAYIFGGELKPRTPIDGKLHVYDLVEQRFVDIEEQGTTPSPRVGLGMTSLNDDIYIWGGRGGKDMSPLSSDLYRFSTTTSTWDIVKAKGTLPDPRSFHVLTSSNGKLYLHGGCPAKGRLGDLYSFDTTELTWTKLPDAPGTGRGGTVLTTTSDKLVRFGGFNGEEIGEGLDTFDTTTQEWKTTSDGTQPPARSVHALHFINGHLVMLHGERDPAPVALGHDGAGKFHSDVWVHGDKGWEEATSETEGPQSRGWFASAVWNDKIVVSGGLNGQNERLNDLFLLEIQ